MGALVFFSLVVKFFGALIEIISQSSISQLWGVEAYGTYSFYVSIVEIIYFIFFSGLVKFNNYYIPQKKFVGDFKKKYYLYYVMSVSVIGLIGSIIGKREVIFFACLSSIAYTCAMDISSTLMSYGNYKLTLIGEYVIGKLTLIGFILLLHNISKLDMAFLYIAYGLQFIIVLIFYLPTKIKIKENLNEKNAINFKEAIKKYFIFQSAECSHIVIVQTPVIVQYIFNGAYETALISIVLIIRKVINFIAGPTSKLYQPEFSKRHAKGDKEGLALVYAQITRLQLCFMTPVFTFLLAAPDWVLKIFSKDLIGYTVLVQWTSVVFLFSIVFGPLSNFLFMTGNEKGVTLINWLSVFVLYGVMFLFKTNSYFVVIGFCAEIIFSVIGRLILYVLYMRKIPMPVSDYIKLFLITIFSIVVVHVLPGNIVYVIGVCGIQFIINFLLVLPKEESKELMSKFLFRKI